MITSGIFSTRAPSRPNPVGISIVRMIKVEDNLLQIQDTDILDGTPVLDIKPYVPEFDQRKEAKIGWLKKRIERFSMISDNGRFAKEN